VKQIEREVGVSRSSVSLWVRDIELDGLQQRRLECATKVGQLLAARRKAEQARRKRMEYQAEGKRLAHARGASYAAGCMLYWGEGGKRRNSVQMSNSDADLLRCFADFLRRHFGVTDKAFRVHCNLFADHVERQDEVEDFWLDALRLPRVCLRKSTVNTYSKYSQKKRANKLPHGTCRLTVPSTRIVQTIYGSIQEYGGFERPEWLD
jgi:hypothetical protein